VHLDGRVAHMPHLTGLVYLAALLASPGHEVSALDLVRMRHGRPAAAVDQDADPVAGAHLAATVRTGTFCCYHPERVARPGS
jgi:hypothetical protein